MKNSIIVFISILFIHSLSSCKDKHSKKIFFKYSKNGKILTQLEHKKYILNRISKFSDYVNIKEIIIDSVISTDSIIKTFKLIVDEKPTTIIRKNIDIH